MPLTATGSSSRARAGEPVVVLGAGPAGLGVAYHALRAGLRPLVLERAAEPGGLCRTFRAGAHRYDSGAHRLHDRDAQVTSELRGLLGDELVRVSAPSQIRDRGRMLDFPPTPATLARQIGLRRASRAALEIASERLRARPERSLADFATRRFGASLARRLVLDYSEKLWGLPAERLAPEAATRRLTGMSLRSLALEVLAPGRRTAHLDGEFLYPLGGYGRIAEALARALPEGALRTETEAARLETSGARVRAVRLTGGEAIPVEGRLVSTIPLTATLRLLGEAAPARALAAARRLRFRDVRLVFLRLARERVSPNASIYLPAPGLLTCRVAEPRNRSPRMAPPGETSLVAEVPCFPGDEVARLPDAELAERVADELASVGLIRIRDVLEWRHRILAGAYPVPEIGHEDAVREVLDALAPLENLSLLGRGGRFVYSHLHDQLAAARELVASLVAAPRARSARVGAG